MYLQSASQAVTLLLRGLFHGLSCFHPQAHFVTADVQLEPFRHRSQGKQLMFKHLQFLWTFRLTVPSPSFPSWQLN